MSGFSNDPMELGHGHIGSWVSWSPDRDLNPQYADLPDVERYGMLIKHATSEGNPCMGSVVFDTPEVRRIYEVVKPTGSAVWQVESWVPLTLSPSILCSCGDHGYIRDGRWIPA